jgi:protein SCO1/2
VTPVRVTVALCLAFVAVVLGMLLYSVLRTPVLSDEQLREVGVFILPRPREIADIHLTTADGEPFTVDDLQGQWSFVFFGFTNCPDICPTSMSVLAQAERRLMEEDPEAAADFQGMLVTVDPERDDLETLERYVRAFSPRFIGVGGERDDIAAFATQVNVAFARMPGNGDDYQVDHTANIVIVNPRGHYHGFAKMPHQADTIVAAFRSLAARF